MVKVQSYRNGEFTGTERIYQNMNQAQALEAFRKEYPDHADCLLTGNYCDEMDEKTADSISTCNKCGSSDCQKREDIIGKPILCHDCYAREIYGECNCDACNNSYYVGDRMCCTESTCNPSYNI